MVQILPRFDPGGEVGKAFGGGVSDALKTQADQWRLQSGLSALDDLDLEKMSYGEIVKNTTKALGGYPGGMQALQEVLPGMLKQKQALEYANSFPEQEPAEGGSVDLDETSQVLEKTTPSYARGGRKELAPQSQKVPGLEEDIPAFKPMSNNERRDMAKRMAKGGYGPREIQESINLEQKRRRDEWDALVEGKKARTEQFREERGLEDVQEDRVRSYISEEIGAPSAQIDPYEMQKGYEYFKNYQQKNPNMKDRQLWNLARKDFNQMRESFSEGENLLERPGFLSLSADRRLKRARDWAQGHLKRYGNFRQDREKLMSMFMDNGYTYGEAASIVKPLNEKMDNAIKGLGKGSVTVPTGLQAGGRDEIPLKGEQREKYVFNLSEKIADNLGPTDSIVLLREKLVRDKNIDEDLFSDALQLAQQKMEEQGRTLSPEQQKEIPRLSEKVKPSLLDIIIGEEKFDIRKYIPRFQK